MSDPTNKVPFPYLGDANNPVVLRYRTADLIMLEQKYGAQFTNEITNRLIGNSSECMVFCLRSGLKQADGRKPLNKGVDYDDLPFGVQDVTQEIIDAIALAITGRSYAQLVEDRREAADRDPDPDPLPDLEMAGSSIEPSRSDTPAVS